MMLSLKKRISLALCMIMLFTFIPVPNAHAAENEPELRNLAKDSTYVWSEAPDYRYPDTGNKLTDGKTGGTNVLDPAWTGHLQKQTREIVFDLGEAKSISSIKSHFLQDWPGSAILFPLTVSMYVSNDNVNWGEVSHKATELLWVDGPPKDQYYVWDGSKDGIPSAGPDAKMAYARYVKVMFSMHPKAWTFLDEIEIIGADGKLEGAKEVPAKPFEYLRPGADTAGIRNLSLVYNGYYSDVPEWTKENLIPEIGYVNKNGELTDWFFDGVLMLGLKSPEGRDFGLDSLLPDWKWYLDKTFKPQGDMSQLNEAVKEVGQKLNQPDYKMKVVAMIPVPAEHVTDFGDVDGDGVSENFNEGVVGRDQSLANRQKAVRWWIQEVLKRWEDNNYSNLELVGLYWLDESISTSESGPDFLRMVNADVHAQGLTSFWIPHSMAYKAYMWKDVGLDAAAYQPNYFFEPLSIDRLVDGVTTAKRFGMGVELEFDNRMLTDEAFRKRFHEYLDAGYEYGFAGQDTFKAYYKGSGPVLRDAANSQDPQVRELYDRLYQFASGQNPGSNTAPVASDASFRTAANTPVSGTLTASDSDGDALTYSIVDNGTKGKAVVTDASTGAFTYTPNGGETGTDMFTFKANDGQSDSNIATVTVAIDTAAAGWQTQLTGASNVQPGEKFTVTYGLNGGSQNIYAQDIRVEYDPAFMELVSVKSVKKGISLIDSDKKTHGKLHLIVASQGEGNAVNGAADLLELTFRVKKEIGSNTGVISISSAVLGDEQGREAQATPSSKTIQAGASLPGDYNGDSKVTVGDLAIVASHYGKTKHSPDWEQVKHMDANGNGKIDDQDLAFVSRKLMN